MQEDDAKRERRPSQEEDEETERSHETIAVKIIAQPGMEDLARGVGLLCEPESHAEMLGELCSPHSHEAMGRNGTRDVCMLANDDETSMITLLAHVPVHPSCDERLTIVTRRTERGSDTIQSSLDVVEGKASSDLQRLAPTPRGSGSRAKQRLSCMEPQKIEPPETNEGETISKRDASIGHNRSALNRHNRDTERPSQHTGGDEDVQTVNRHARQLFQQLSTSPRRRSPRIAGSRFTKKFRSQMYFPDHVLCILRLCMFFEHRTERTVRDASTGMGTVGEGKATAQWIGSHFPLPSDSASKSECEKSKNVGQQHGQDTGRMKDKETGRKQCEEYIKEQHRLSLIRADLIHHWSSPIADIFVCLLDP